MVKVPLFNALNLKTDMTPYVGLKPQSNGEIKYIAFHPEDGSRRTIIVIQEANDKVGFVRPSWVKSYASCKNNDDEVMVEEYYDGKCKIVELSFYSAPCSKSPKFEEIATAHSSLFDKIQQYLDKMVEPTTIMSYRNANNISIQYDNFHGITYFQHNFTITDDDGKEWDCEVVDKVDTVYSRAICNYFSDNIITPRPHIIKAGKEKYHVHSNSNTEDGDLYLYYKDGVIHLCMYKSILELAGEHPVLNTFSVLNHLLAKTKNGNLFILEQMGLQHNTAEGQKALMDFFNLTDNEKLDFILSSPYDFRGL